MRPTPRLLRQAAKTGSTTSLLQRLANSPMSPPAETYPLFILIGGMLSFGGYSAYREFKYDRNLRLQRQKNWIMH